MTDDEKKARIRELNDELRAKRLVRNGKIIITGDLTNEVDDRGKIMAILDAIRDFNDFPKGNDPYREHDFGRFTVGDDTFIFKIDYYALDEAALSPHPEDPATTIRVMSVFYAHDY
jgi:hypothetical protein